MMETTMKNTTRRINRILSMATCFGLLASTSAVSMGQAQKPEAQVGSAEGFTLTATTTKKEFAPCEPITVEIVLSNATSGVLSLEGFGTKNDYDIDVKDKNATGTPQTRYGEMAQVKRFGGGNRTMAILQPGESIHGYVTINQMFDMSLPGVYSIVVKRAGIPKQTGDGRITLISVPVEIEILNISPFR
jgi:hypothetical protein